VRPKLPKSFLTLSGHRRVANDRHSRAVRDRTNQSSSHAFAAAFQASPHHYCNSGTARVMEGVSQTINITGLTWNYSLGTLLIATTLIAVVLGLAVWAIGS
jgi:hypothetical protein